jgi:CHAD domain-containing protein
MPELPQRHELLKSRLDRFTRLLHGVEQGDMRAIHRTRVASRRLRELLPVLQLKENRADKLNRSLRRITRQLGAIRELDVLLLLIDELRDTDRYPEPALARVEAEIRKAREEAREELPVRAIVTKLRRVRRRLEDIAADFEEGGDQKARDRGWRWAIDARVARRATSLREAIRAAGGLYLPERLHTIRIALKKLRYGLELAVDAAGSGGGSHHVTDAAADLTKLRRGQDVLGKLHDLQVLIDRVRAVQASFDSREAGTRRDLDALVIALEQGCRRLHGRYVRERTSISAICDRLITRSERSQRPARARRAG